MADPPTTREVETRHGIARLHLRPVARPVAALVLGHGAGGGVGAPDLVAVADAAADVGLAVALVEQPYRVAGRRAPPRAPVLDAAWVDVVAHLREIWSDTMPETSSGGPLLVVGGRSSGARVACRTAADVGAVGVLCLAFPLTPPARAGRPEPPSRLDELDAVEMPVLVVQGERDPFGMPPQRERRTVVVVRGDHALTADLAAVRTAAREWLGGRAEYRPSQTS
ncbi:alpha/beta family hydrolase [Cellulomonas fimi]|uniref:Alpha/beta hydrolase n=1 Tax=Cellulomonas fimi TaxID=1708 RepID=A0A7Y0M095_CELFI|nr:alpha/beta family hydrolase [Cellulomonas fimi]NMR20683.1 alpha/beta hydrolase [Cellulomonas fimi]